MKLSKAASSMTHDNASKLLPWYINGTLSSDEQRSVQEHLRGCIECQKHQTELVKLAFSAKRVAMPELPPAQASFNRLMQRIDSEAKLEGRGNKKPGYAQRLYNYFARISGGTYLAKPIWAMAVLVLVILVAPAGTWFASSLVELPEASYRTLSDPRSTANTGVNDIQVIFSPALDSKERSRILAAIHGETVSGPNKQGLYVVRIHLNPGAEADMRRVLATLRRESGVLFAEPAMPSSTVAAAQDGKK